MGALQQMMMAHGAAAGGGSFPTNGVLDNFNRANESPATGWTVALSGAANIEVISNQAVSMGTPTYAYTYWNAGSFAADQEAFVLMPVAPIAVESIGLLLRWDASAGVEDGFLIEQNGAVITVYEIANGSFGQLGATIANVPANGDSLGATVIGTTLTVYFKVGAGAWSALDTRAVTRNTTGYIGLQIVTTTPRADDFGGGAT